MGINEGEDCAKELLRKRIARESKKEAMKKQKPREGRSLDWDYFKMREKGCGVIEYLHGKQK